MVATSRLRTLDHQPKGGIGLNRKINLLLTTTALFFIAYLCLFTLTHVGHTIPKLPSQVPKYTPPAGTLEQPIPRPFEGPKIPNGPGLTIDLFKSTQLSYHAGNDANRFLGNDPWRPLGAYEDIRNLKDHRPDVSSLTEYKNKADYLRQPLVADYAIKSSDMFFMLKTSSKTIWESLPIHLSTTLTRVPNFAIYSDMGATVGGHEVIDILQNVTESTKKSDEFEAYRKLHKLRDMRGTVDLANFEIEGLDKLDKFMVLPMLLHGWRQAPGSKWFVYMESTSFVFMDNLMKFLDGLNPNDQLYLGSPVVIEGLSAAAGDKVVILSSGAMKATFGMYPQWVTESESRAMEVGFADYMVAWMMDRANIKMAPGSTANNAGLKFQGTSIPNLVVDKETWCQKVLSFSDLKGYDIETLWEYERLLGPVRRQDIRFGDLYYSFIAPFIDFEMNNWDNGASMLQYSKAHDDSSSSEGSASTQPWSSKEECKKACYATSNCLMWRYLPEENYCAVDLRVRLGSPHIDFLTPKSSSSSDSDSSSNSSRRSDPKRNLDGVVSGYNLERLRFIRRKEQFCDVLYEASDAKYADDEFGEGWLLRQEIKYKADQATASSQAKEKEEKEKAEKKKAEEAQV